jgi:hypothetical protein
MFVNVTHPSQIRDKNVQRTVRAFTSLQNKRRRKGDQRQQIPSHPKKRLEIPQSLGAPDDETASSFDLSIIAGDGRYDSESTLLPSDPEEDQDVQGTGISLRSTNNSLILFPERKVKDPISLEPEEILEIFPAVGNIPLPYSSTNLSPQTAARLRRLTQFYIEFDGPTSIWRPQQLIHRSNIHLFKRDFFAMSMTHPIIMETIFSGSQLRLDPPHSPSPLVFQHRANVLRMIESRITSPTEMLDDVTFFAVMGMITLDAFTKNWPSFKSNLDGFHMLVVLRGGIETLGWQGWFQSHLGWCEYQWATHIARSKQDMLVPPTYPRHPFPPALSSTVSKLPEGLIEAALLRNLSIEVLDLLLAVNSWTASYSDEEQGKHYLGGLSLITHIAALMGKYEISRCERIFCIATFAFVIETDHRTEETRTPRGLEDYLVGIQRLHAGLPADDMLLWAAVVIAVSNDDPKVSSGNKWRVLDYVMDAEVECGLETWGDVKERMRKFFWNEKIERMWERCWEVAIERKRRRTRGKEKGRRGSVIRLDPPEYNFGEEQIRRLIGKVAEVE